MMDTLIHFRENGKHRIVSAENEFYTHKEVLPILVENGIKPDDSRFMLTYKQTKPKGNTNDQIA